MIGITWIHVAGDMIALASGAVAVAVRKGRRHVRLGRHLVLERSRTS